MTEFRRPNWEDTYIWTEAVWDAAFRAMLTELTNAQAWAMFHETDAGGGVVGGFAWSTPSGITTRIGRGLALVYDAGIAAPGPKWKVVYLGANTDLAHSARHATLARVDAVSLSYVLADDTAQTLGRSAGAAPASTDTQAGSVATLVITAGTAHASPWANAGVAPAGNLLLYYVYVPSTAVGTAPVAYEARSFVPGPSNRPYDQAIVLRGDPGSATYYELFDIKAPAYQGGAGYTSRWLHHAGEDWPCIERSGMGFAGEEAGEFYPMMIPTSRTWRRSYSLGNGGGVRYSTGSATEIAVASYGLYTQILRVTSGANVGSFSVPLPADSRALKITDFRLSVRLQTAFTGTVNTLKAELIKVTAAGGTSVLGTKALNGLSVGAWTTLVATDFGPLTQGVLADGEALYVMVNWDVAASAGELWVGMAELALKEGQG